ncbi:hypothetical protein M413DRAFT_429877, partial [Hebeloma cylindrosporum]
VASLAFLFYEIFITFDDEVNIIWSYAQSLTKSTNRTNRAIEIAITKHLSMVTTSLKGWYMCQVVFGGILMAGVEAVLMARVYALYQKSLRVGLVFLALILGEAIAVIIGVVKHIPGDDFSASSLLLTSPGSYTYFGIGAIITQITILVLTLVKYKTAVKEGWGKAPIMMLMVRDGTVVFFAFLILTITTVIYTNWPTEYYALIGTSWFLSVVASAGCRLIINMQKLPEQETDELPTTVQLTTLYHDLGMETYSYRL